ncbi:MULTISPECIES: hypothetical protein [unclassified Rhizobium]|uniref:hypothetical protein n=1 Tax=unclassified Rhizobium TaxID=2613769 RepID=UPI001C83ECF6|nr:MULTISPECIES: hypothetical protein [unclassified Rhizobium]MBX5162649.1 hypothetical protein [Rhizobium sp. NZLR4b]MBX5187502.1 hypothetical protein [Rhizobium sp. NZLR3b]
MPKHSQAPLSGGTHRSCMTRARLHVPIIISRNRTSLVDLSDMENIKDGRKTTYLLLAASIVDFQIQANPAKLFTLPPKL